MTAMDSLKQLRDELHKMGGRDERLLADLAERVSNELAEAYACISCIARIREAWDPLRGAGIWEKAYRDIIERAKADHRKVIV